MKPLEPGPGRCPLPPGVQPKQPSGRREPTEATKMKNYICFYFASRVEVNADTTVEALNKAQAEFKKMFPRNAVNRYEVMVYTAEHYAEAFPHDV